MISLSADMNLFMAILVFFSGFFFGFGIHAFFAERKYHRAGLARRDDKALQLDEYIKKLRATDGLKSIKGEKEE